MDATPTPIGVGFDTARYGHHVTFLREDLQLATQSFEFQESQKGYERLQQKFQQLAQRTSAVHFHIRIDAAGQYATNLEAFLRQLPYPKTISVGEPARNQKYRQALFPKRKADPVESYCAARFALVEKPAAKLEVAAEFYHLREIASRLESQACQSTRFTNQLHNLMARVFPELAQIANDFQAQWLLGLLDKYPTAQQLARAQPRSLTAIPHVTTDKAESLQAAARGTVASLSGPVAEQLVRTLVKQLRQSLMAEDELKSLLVSTFEALPHSNLINTIPGIGDATAAVLTAKIVSIDRFQTPEDVVGYFGIFPEDDSSGLDKEGQPRPGRQQHMSKKGNDLVRKYLWNAAKSASQHNPAVRALYRRLVGRGVRGDVALGHCMRKLLHLVFAVWKTGKPFDPVHYPWEQVQEKGSCSGPNAPGKQEAAGHKEADPPQRQVVTAAPATVTMPAVEVKPSEATASVPDPGGSGGTGHSGPRGTTVNPWVDFAAIREQVSMELVLAHLGHLSKLKGSGAQRRGPCPLHGPGDCHNHTFSANLNKAAFQCFHPPCAAKGNVLDLWAAVHHLPLRDAALHLAATFNLNLEIIGTEKRNPLPEPVHPNSRRRA